MVRRKHYTGKPLACAGLAVLEVMEAGQPYKCDRCGGWVFNQRAKKN